jgi:hypothetical protein
VAPNVTLLLFTMGEAVGSMISAVESFASISPMRPSMNPCCSRAAWYSAFSDRSPWLRASAMALMTLGRSSVLSRYSSLRSASAPRRVIG